MRKLTHSGLTREDHFVLGFVLQFVHAVLMARTGQRSITRPIEKKLDAWLGKLRCVLDDHICAEHKEPHDIHAYYGGVDSTVLRDDPDALAAIKRVLGAIEAHHDLRFELTHVRSRDGWTSLTTSTAHPPAPAAVGTPSR